MDADTAVLERRIETWMNDAAKGGARTRPVRLVERWNDLKKKCKAAKETAKEGKKNVEELMQLQQAVRLAQAMLEQEAESYEFEVERVAAHAAAHRRDEERYREEYERLEERDRQFVQDIAEKKAELVRAREEQTLALKLDELRKKCAELPSRTETEARMREVDAEIEAALEEERALNEMFASKSKQYALAAHAMNELAEVFDNAVAGEEEQDDDEEEEGEEEVEEEDEGAGVEEGDEKDQAQQGQDEQEEGAVPKIEG